MNGELILTKLQKELELEFKQNLLPFWTEFAIDDKNGGFIGRVTSENVKVYDADKGGILNARILWALSAAYKQYPSKKLSNVALRAYEYFNTYFMDEKYGGFFWMIDSKGEVVDPKKHIYTQAFGIYGLVEYYSAFNNHEALKLAYNIYSLIEKHSVDSTYGGYFEAYSREWELNEDVRLSEKDENEPKSMNTHLHILEAYTNLYRYAPSEKLKDKLASLIHYFCDYIINPERTSLINFFGLDWSPRSKQISYGHDIESSWLLVEAAEVIGDEHLIDVTRQYAVSIANAVIGNGIDSDGALINEANPKGYTDTDKDWWPQAEAIVGFLNAYEISGDIKFLEAAGNSWMFIKQHLIDRKYGEWFEKTSREGTPYSQLDKVRAWKGPYHNMRTIFEVNRRVKALLKREPVFVEEKLG
ncbi:MAG: N-acyl-D-glucosamine 2-epimerase [Balneola sp.]|nr:MAG: N-acyl-D-glucosamine 2-epimerase [Balneola sp.]